MDSALILSALMMGLAGGPHCALMCDAAFGGVAARHGPAGALLITASGFALAYGLGDAIDAAICAARGA